MFLPTLGIVVFTVLPLIFMISMAFTSYDHKHLVLFHWVGFENFAKVFSNSGGTVNAALFGRVLVWTLVWAFFATFLNFFLGMFVAMIINRKTTHFKVSGAPASPCPSPFRSSCLCWSCTPCSSRRVR